MDPVFFNLKYAASMRPPSVSATGSDEQDFARQSDFADQDEVDPYHSQQPGSSSNYYDDNNDYYDDYSYSNYYDDYGQQGQSGGQQHQ